MMIKKYFQTSALIFGLSAFGLTLCHSLPAKACHCTCSFKRSDGSEYSLGSFSAVDKNQCEESCKTQASSGGRNLLRVSCSSCNCMCYFKRSDGSESTITMSADDTNQCEENCQTQATAGGRTLARSTFSCN